ncbi:Acid-sensing ion channel 1 [Exaiptasia diaphana]|nr:Acid-sensing ion channel 1 [Exaiptasia diaphana]
MADTTERANDDSFKTGKNKCQYVQQFCCETSLHGVRFLFDRKGVVRLLWFLALGTAFAFCGYQIYWTFHDFFQRPFSTTIITKRPREISFPAVTICNLNHVSKKEYAKATRAYEVNKTDEQLERDIQLTMASMQRRGNQSDLSSNDELSMFKLLNASENYHRRGNRLLNTLKQYSHKIEGMLSFDWIEPCVWRGVKCSPANFSSFVTLRMGQCFTFNSGEKGHERLKSYIPGPTNGLRLRLNVEEEDHVSDSTSNIAGFKVSIQHQDEYPGVDEFGFALQPGTHTFAAIRAFKMKRLEDPYEAKCSSPKDEISKAYNKTYSVNSCSLLCFMRYIAQACGCQLMMEIIQRRPQSVRDCVAKCPEPCEQMVYETKLSYASASSKAFIKRIKSPTLQNMTMEEKVEYIRNNMVSLDVYFEEIKYDLVNQTESISTTSLFGCHIDPRRNVDGELVIF